MNLAEQMASIRSDIETLEQLRVEAEYEYTSKARLRILAQAGIGSALEQRKQALAMLTQMQEQEAAAESRIVQPAHAGDIVTP